MLWVGGVYMNGFGPSSVSFGDSDLFFLEIEKGWKLGDEVVVGLIIGWWGGEMYVDGVAPVVVWTREKKGIAVGGYVEK